MSAAKYLHVAKENSYSTEFKDLYHSFSDEERKFAISQLSELDTSDSVRELIHVFNECGWRDTQIEIIQSLKNSKQDRAFQFLVYLVCSEEDLVFKDKALRSLAVMPHPLGFYFIEEHFNKLKTKNQMGSPMMQTLVECLSLKPLVKSHFHLNELLEQALQQKNYQLIKSLVITLGELKSFKSYVHFVQIIKDSHINEVKLSALMSLGKISRDPQTVQSLGVNFSQDPFEKQILTQVLQQVEFRSKWSVLDYFNKMIESNNYHPHLVLEFNSFDLHEMKTLIDLLIEEKMSEKVFKLIYLREKSQVIELYSHFCHKLDNFNFDTIEEKSTDLAFFYLEYSKLIESLSGIDHKSEFKKTNTILNQFMIFAKRFFLNGPKSDSSFGRSSHELNQHSERTPLSSHLERYFQALTKYYFHESDVKFSIEIAQNWQEHVLNPIFKEKELFQIKLEEVFQIQFLNFLNSYLLVFDQNHKLKSTVLSDLTQLVQNKLINLDQASSSKIFNRIIRLFAEVQFESHEIVQSLTQYLIKTKDFNSSIVYYFSIQKSDFFLHFIEKNNIQIPTSAGLSLLNVLLNCKENVFEKKFLNSFFTEISKENDLKIQKRFLKLIAKWAPYQFKKSIEVYKNSEDRVVQFYYIQALKNYKDETLVDQLAPSLFSNSHSISGRALDALCSFKSARAQRLIFDFLIEHPLEFEIYDKILRSLEPIESLNEFYERTLKLLKTQIEADVKLNAQFVPSGNLTLSQEKLREIFKLIEIKFLEQQKMPKMLQHPTQHDLIKIDHDLQKMMPHFDRLDHQIKSALRAAEIPFHMPQIHDQFVDKSAVIIEYCKAIDLFLEKHLGQKVFKPRLDLKLSEFQNVFMLLGLNSDYPDAHKILKMLKLEKDFSAQSLQVHKMSLIAKSFLNGKIVHDYFKVIDGLRAWSIVLILFSRKSEVMAKPLIIINDSFEAKAVELAKKLIYLQEIRNPMAHRDTLVDFIKLEDFRNESKQILRLLDLLFLS